MKTFMECASCANKPGSPVLCVSCIYNRNLVAELNVEVYEARAEGWNAAVEACAKAACRYCREGRPYSEEGGHYVNEDVAIHCNAASIRALSIAKAEAAKAE